MIACTCNCLIIAVIVKTHKLIHPEFEVLLPVTLSFTCKVCVNNSFVLCFVIYLSIICSNC